jgi:hypothetical protein
VLTLWMVMMMMLPPCWVSYVAAVAAQLASGMASHAVGMNVSITLIPRVWKRRTLRC